MNTVHGLSRVTLAKVRQLYADKFVDFDTSGPGFATKVNEVIERFYMDSTWVGSVGIFEVSVPDSGILTLPLFLESVLHAQFSDTPRPVVTDRYEFLAHGVGQIDPLTSGLGVLVDAGAVGIYGEFPDTPGVLTLTHSANDAGKEVRILGVDANGVEIYDEYGIPGELVSLSGTSTNTTSTFSDVLGIQKPRTVAPVIVKQGTVELANIPPAITNPVYRRYKVAHAAAAGEPSYLRLFCSRQAIPVSNEEDYVVPGNLPAIKMGLYSLTYEESNDIDRADKYWARAINFLNQEAAKHRGGALQFPTVAPSGLGVGKTRRLL